MRPGTVLALWLTLAPVAAASPPRIGRDAIAALERKFDRRIQSYDINDPFHLLGNTRGVYLADYGVVFTAEINLVAAAVVTPFRPPFTPEQIEQLREKKLRRLEDLKRIVREMMVECAAALDGVAPEQKIAVGVSLFRFSWEDSRGLPRQILMEASRRTLLDFKAGKLGPEELLARIRYTEY